MSAVTCAPVGDGGLLDRAVDAHKWGVHICCATVDRPRDIWPAERGRDSVLIAVARRLACGPIEPILVVQRRVTRKVNDGLPATLASLESGQHPREVGSRVAVVLAIERRIINRARIHSVARGLRYRAGGWRLCCHAPELVRCRSNKESCAGQPQQHRWRPSEGVECLPRARGTREPVQHAALRAVLASQARAGAGKWKF